MTVKFGFRLFGQAWFRFTKSARVEESLPFWFLISIIFKSHVLGRDISKIKLIQSTLKSLFFFSGFVSILNLMFFNMEFRLLTIISAASIFYFLNL